MEWYDQITEKANTNTMNYVETRMEKKHQGGERERGEFHYNNSDYNEVLWCARISRFKSLPRWKRFSIYTGCISFDKVAQFTSI